MLGLYFTEMHGDRPRWREGAALLKSHIQLTSARQAPVFSSAPGVICYDLGVPANQTMQSKVAEFPPADFENSPPEAWYVIDPAGTSPSLKAGLQKYGQFLGSFEARTGPRDR